MRKRENQIQLGDNEYKISDLDTPKKNKISEELKHVRYNDLGDLVHRFQITHGEVVDILDVKHIPTSSTRYTLPPGVYKTSHDISMLKTSK